MSKTAKRLMVFCIGVLIAFALPLMPNVGSVNGGSAYANTGSLVGGSPATKASTAAVKVATTKAAQTKRGNLDKYINLKETSWVFAIGRKSVPIYKQATTKSKRIASYQAKSCIVVDMSGMKAGRDYHWLKVKLKGSRRGYVQLSKVELRALDTATFGLRITSQNSYEDRANTRRAAICRFGLKYLGTKYSHGSSLTKGLHCGSFVKKCFNKHGFKFSSADVRYLGSRGKRIARSEVKPGDMVFYSSGRTRYGHVAIYIGSGLIVNSSGRFGTIYPRGGIRVSTLDYRTPHPFAFRNVIGN